MDYNRYLEAVRYKKEWESKRSKMQSERYRAHTIYSIEDMPDGWIEQLRYIIAGLSLDIAKERDILKRSILLGRDSVGLKKRLDRSISDRVYRMKELYIELKQIQTME